MKIISPLRRKKKPYSTKPPKNKVIIRWFVRTSGMKPTIENFSGVKTEAAARKIISKRNRVNLRMATWWNEESKPFDLLPLKKDTVSNP